MLAASDPDTANCLATETVTVRGGRDSGLNAGNGPLSQAAERRHLRLCAYRVSSFRADDGDQRCLGSWPHLSAPGSIRRSPRRDTRRRALLWPA